MRRLLLLAWLPLAVFLFPLPPQAGKQLMNELHEMRRSVQPHVAGTPKDSLTQPAVSEAELDAVISALWIRWIQNLSWLAVGIFVGVAAWRGHRHWQLFAVCVSVLYLGFVIFSYFRVDRTVPDALLFFETESNLIKIWQLKLRLVEVGISNGSFLRPAWIVYNEILMPIFQITVLAWMLWLYSIKSIKRARL